MLNNSSEKISSRSSGQDNNFNLLRMLAATGVLVSHAYPISLGRDAIQPLETVLHGKTLGGLCVTIFFAISGFFIARSFERTSSLGSFCRARVLRLLPALAMVLIVTVIVAAFLTTASLGVYWSAAVKYFLHNVSIFFLKYDLPGVFQATPYGGAVNGSLWTLKYEAICYGGVVLCGLAGLLSRPAVFTSSLFTFLCLSYLGNNLLDLGLNIDKMMSLILPFGIGMAFWCWRDQVPLSFEIALIGGLAALASWYTAFFMPVFALAVCYLIFVIGYAKFPALSSYNKLGDYSYGMYVYAFPIQQTIAWTGVTSPYANIAISVPITLVCAVLSWHFVEKPALKWKKRRGVTALH